MKINQVEELVGITKKNIRFYEEQGLVSPDRDPQNGYREYTLEDVERLGLIKLFRQLGVPCEEIRQMLDGKLPFDRCMRDNIRKLEKSGEDIGHMIEMCRAMEAEVDDISDINASEYLEKMRSLEKGGVSFVNIRSSDVKKRKAGAMIAGMVMIAFTAALLVLVLVMNRADPAPKVVLVMVILICGGTIAGVAIALVQRFRELEGGEIDEANKY